MSNKTVKTLMRLAKLPFQLKRITASIRRILKESILVSTSLLFTKYVGTEASNRYRLRDKLPIDSLSPAENRAIFSNNLIERMEIKKKVYTVNVSLGERDNMPTKPQNYHHTPGTNS